MENVNQTKENEEVRVLGTERVERIRAKYDEPASDGSGCVFEELKEQTNAEPLEPKIEDVGQKESTLDRWLKVLESKVAYYAANHDQLYRLYVALSVFTGAMTLLLVSENLFKLRFYFDDLSISGIVSVVSSVVYPLVMIVLALGLKKRVEQKREVGITLFAVLLVLQIFSFSLLTFAVGALAFLNPSFRAYAKPWSPKWYQDMCAWF